MNLGLYVNQLLLKSKDDIDRKKFPYNLKVVQKIDKIIFDTRVTFIIGENGCGKSTLLEAIAIKLNLNPEGGNQNMFFSTYRSHSNLLKELLAD